MVTRVLAAAVILVVAIILLVAGWPQLLGLERTMGVAQLASFRAAALVAAAAVVVVLLLVALVSRRIRRFAASLALVAVAFGALEGIVIVDRGLGNPSLPTAASGDVTVLEWNTLGNSPGASAVASLAVEHRADVVVMPETTSDFGEAVASTAARAGLDYAVLSTHFDLISRARSTTMLVAKRLGTYSIDSSAGSTGQLPSIVARPTDGKGPTLVAVHVVAPTPGEFTTWQHDLDWVAQTCSGDDVIMAGDFNSTVDHWGHLPHAAGATVGDCTDAALTTGNGSVGTWPTSIPALLGTPIDHVLAGSGWRVTGMRVITDEDGAGSDHRPTLTQLTPATVKP
jgi:endonuclease/exonuclease/phosphatase (EEP) superfamily protein YafD